MTSALPAPQKAFGGERRFVGAGHVELRRGRVDMGWRMCTGKAAA